MYAEGLKRIAGSGENDYRRFLLAECLEAYAELDESQKERLQALLHAEAYREVEPLMKTTYERGIEDGIERGMERGMERGIGSRGIEQGERRLTPCAQWKPSSARLVVRFTNNVSVSLVFDVRQPTLLRNAAMHAVANSVSLVE